MILLLSTAFPLLVGFLLVNGLGPWGGGAGRKTLSKVLLGAGLGIGASSCITFIGLFLLPPMPVWHLLLEGILGCALLTFLVVSFRGKTPPPRVSEPVTPSPWWNGFPLTAVYVALLIAAVFAAASFWHISSRQPHGEWDGWAIWNMRARFLFRGGEYWRDAFSPLLGWSHPDYPLLLPSSVVRVWNYMGSESIAGPFLLAGVFTFGTVAVLVLSLDNLVGRPQGALAGLFLLGFPYFILYGASQYADVPLGFYILLANVFLRLSAEGEHGYGNAALAGMSAGFAAWTKNEGMLFIVAIGASLVVPLVLPGERRRGLQRIAGFLAGLLPVVAVIAVFKMGLAPPGDLLQAQGAGVIWEKLSDWDRYETVLRSLGRIVVFVSPGFLFLAAYSLFVGVGEGRDRRMGVVEVLVGLTVMLLGYTLVYVITPHPLQWHIDNSLPRLLIQLWPSFVFACFIGWNTPFRREIVAARPEYVR